VKGIKKYFVATKPKECLRLLIQYLMDEGFCYIQDDPKDLNVNGTRKCS